MQPHFLIVPLSMSLRQSIPFKLPYSSFPERGKVAPESSRISHQPLASAVERSLSFSKSNCKTAFAKWDVFGFSPSLNNVLCTLELNTIVDLDWLVDYHFKPKSWCSDQLSCLRRHKVKNDVYNYEENHC